MHRWFVGMILIVCLAFTSLACGQQDPPSVEDLQKNIELVNLPIPGGGTIRCLYYGARGDRGYSWLILDCDWDSLQRR